MGIKHFFYWFRHHHSDCLTRVAVDKPLSEQGVQVDVLAIDLNGMFHTAAQKVFGHGNHQSFLRKTLPVHAEKELRLCVFKEVCRMIDRLVDYATPAKKLLLCVDGVAGVSKCQQQRQRRFKSAKERSGIFDSCSITPGTRFMHYLTLYIDWYIHHRVNNNDWTFEVVFSNEKVVGEGEHKCKMLFKKYCDAKDKMMIYGLDADLVMLCLSTGLCNIVILRDNLHNINERYVVDIWAFASKLKSLMQTESAVLDFVLLCFMVGNDFLPQLPGLEIASNGIDYLIDAYNRCCRPTGLVDPATLTIHFDRLVLLFNELATYEQHTIHSKYKNRRNYFKDPLLDVYYGEDCNFIRYQEQYYTQKCNKADVQTMCTEYVRGLEWIIRYYGDEIPSWEWCYPYHYAPFLDDLKRYTYSPTTFGYSEPLRPFEQLLAVLPPQSKTLLPSHVRTVMETDQMKPMYPLEFTIDIDGKRSAWEGIALLPIMNISMLRQLYLHCTADYPENRLNKREQSVIIKYIEKKGVYTSIYGNIRNCNAFKQELVLS